MKIHFLFLAYSLSLHNVYAQTPCNGDADGLPGKYTDHTQPKYPGHLGGDYSAQDKATMTKQMIALEKIEEASRANFQLTGCVARVSFSTLSKPSFGGYFHAAYEYQLAAYQNVCHVTQHIVKTVDEYRTVFRVSINPGLANPITPGGTGEFYLTDKNKSVRYYVSIDARDGPNNEKDRMHPTRISQYMSESVILGAKSNDYKNKHRDFLNIINGEGYVENWMQGSKDDKPDPKAYKWVDRYYLITKPGLPLLIPVTRKQYLEDLLEYFEVEKANFYYSLEAQLKNANDKKRQVLEADRQAYPDFYEKRKAKVLSLLATQKPDWLQALAVVGKNSNTYDAWERLDDIGKFHDVEDEKNTALYIYNPAYFKIDAAQPVKPIFFVIEFRYELGAGRGFSARLLDNFVKNYDFAALRKMIQ